MTFPGLIVGFPGKLHRLVARLGWGIGTLYLLHRVLSGLTRGRADLHVYRLVLQPVQKGPLLPQRWRGGIDVRRLDAGDPEIAGALSRRAELTPRLARGDVCLAAFAGGRIAGYLWLCFAPFDDDETHCRFEPQPGEGGAWDYDLWVAPQSRGGGIFAALWDEAWAVLRQRGYRWTASRVSAFNDLSLRAHRRLGARQVGTILVLRGGRCWVMSGSVGPRVRVWRRGAAPARVIVHAIPDSAGPSSSHA